MCRVRAPSPARRGSAPPSRGEEPAPTPSTAAPLQISLLVGSSRSHVGCARVWLRRDEFALQTIPNDKQMVAFVTTRDTDGECYCDFLDGTTPETCNPPFPQLCRFVLHSPNQYSAAKRLQKWKERVGDDEGELEKLQLAAAAEDEVNKTEFQMCSGNPAIFGNIYQLLNPAADQFLQVERSISEEDSAALKCCLLEKNVRTKNPVRPKDVYVFKKRN